MKKAFISFLLGAGFSKPAGYPLASEINKKFVGLKEGEISIHTDGSAWFNEGNPRPNDWFAQKKERLFVERLLNYYCSKVISSSDSFHYETFYDWYKDIRNKREQDTAVQSIAENLGNRLDYYLDSFNLTFSQLIAQLLGKRFPEVHLGQGLPRSHARFLDLVKNLSREHILHFHTLNHDLFFESLSKTDAMKGNLADGFTELGSPYYGALRCIAKSNTGGTYSYRVRLPYFSGAFNSRFNLYKLHGSIDQYFYHDKKQEVIKDKRGIDINNLSKEVKKWGKLKYEKFFGSHCPNFLLGSTYKTTRYESNAYYRKVFKCFESNLRHSNVVVVIGYGFGDKKINCLLREHFLSRSGSRVLIVDVNKPDLPDEIERCSEFFLDGVSNFDYEKLMTSIYGRPSAG